MSTELTLEILETNGYYVSTAEYINFVATASLSMDEKKMLLQAVEGLEELKKPLKNTQELKQFIQKHLDLPIPPEKIMMFLKELPDELDSRKTVVDHQKLLSMVPVEYLNKYSLPNLVSKTMNEEFWASRVTNPENVAFFEKRFGATAQLQGVDKKIEHLKNILHKETGWDHTTFASIEAEASSKEEFLTLLEKDARSLGLDY